MQTMNNDHTWNRPEEVDLKDLTTGVNAGRLKDHIKALEEDVTQPHHPCRMVLFASHDEQGRPTRELRRAWRRHYRTKGRRVAS